MARKRGQGEGSIFQRADGLWVAAISTPEGRKVRYAKTRQLAAQKLQELQAQAAGGLPEARRDITVEVMLEEYLEAKTPHWSPRTLNIAEGICRTHIMPTLADVKLSALDVRRVSAWLRTLGQTRTAQLARAHLSRACELAVRYEWLPRNPVALVEIPKVTVRRPKDLSREEIRAILAAAKSPPAKSPRYAKATDADYYPLVALLLGSGLRIGEALGLTWDDWRPATRTLLVQRSLGREGGKANSGPFALRGPKTAAGVREVVVPGFVAEALESLDRPQASEWNLIFCTTQGAPLAARNVRRGVYALLARSGIEGITLHHLRHAYASMLLDDGVPLPVVSSVLGHADVGITARIYAHRLKGSHTRAAEAIEGILGDG